MSSAAQNIERQAPTQNSRGSRPQESQRSSSRPAGKGRRRRAAAEQRRVELQQLGELSEYLNDEQHSGSGSPSEVAGARSYEGPRPPGTRRQQRRASRRALAAAEAAASREEIEDYFNFAYQRTEHSHSLPGSAHIAWSRGSASLPSAVEEEDLELALAVSLSLSESGSVRSARAIQRTLQGDLSYENLVNLEDVSLTLAKDQLESLPVRNICSGEADEMCPICLGEFVEGDAVVSLPCCHSFHQSCGAEWLLHYSKSCPVCKQSVGGVKSDGDESSD